MPVLNSWLRPCVPTYYLSPEDSLKFENEQFLSLLSTLPVSTSNCIVSILGCSFTFLSNNQHPSNVKCLETGHICGLQACVLHFGKKKLGKLLIISKWWTTLMLNRKVLEMWKIELLLSPSGITYLFFNCLLFPFPRIQVIHSCLVVKSNKHDNVTMTTALVAITINATGNGYISLLV